MKPTTITTCDDNIPRPTLFMTPALLEAALLDHYHGVWLETGAMGDMPTEWQAVHDEIKEQGLLLDRHIAHIHEHDLFSEAA